MHVISPLPWALSFISPCWNSQKIHSPQDGWRNVFRIVVFLFFVFCLFRASLAACGGSQARGPIGTAAAGLHHSHSNTRSEPHLQPTSQLTERQILNPVSKARDQTQNLMVPSWICFHCAVPGTPSKFWTLYIITGTLMMSILTGFQIPVLSPGCSLETHVKILSNTHAWPLT